MGFVTWESLPVLISLVALLVSLLAIYRQDKSSKASLHLQNTSNEASQRDRNLDRLAEKAKAAIEITVVALEVIAEARDLLRYQHKRWGSKFDENAEDNKNIEKYRREAECAYKLVDELFEDPDIEGLEGIHFVRLQHELNTVLHGKARLKMIRARIQEDLQSAVL